MVYSISSLNLFEGEPDVPVLPFRVNSMVFYFVLLITSKQKLIEEHFIMFFF